MNKISAETMKEFEKTIKVGLVSTVDDIGDPHITILSTIMAKSEDKMMFGEFITGLSKEYIRQNNKSGFLIMNLQKEFWTGTMKWTHSKTEGEDYIMYNMQPKYRYNSYFGIHTVHYLDLVDVSEKRVLNMKDIIINALKVLIRKCRVKGNTQALKPWAYNLMKKIDTLTFISYINQEGYPVIIPQIPAQASSPDTIVLSDKPYAGELSKINKGARVAVFGLNLQMENVLVKGVFSGFDKGIASVKIDRVYNSMPPKMNYIYDTVKSI